MVIYQKHFLPKLPGGGWVRIRSTPKKLLYVQGKRQQQQQQTRNPFRWCKNIPRKFLRVPVTNASKPISLLPQLKQTNKQTNKLAAPGSLQIQMFSFAYLISYRSVNWSTAEDRRTIQTFKTLLFQLNTRHKTIRKKPAHNFGHNKANRQQNLVKKKTLNNKQILIFKFHLL